MRRCWNSPLIDWREHSPPQLCAANHTISKRQNVMSGLITPSFSLHNVEGRIELVEGEGMGGHLRRINTFHLQQLGATAPSADFLPGRARF